MRINHASDILAPLGEHIKVAAQAQYLGSLLTVTGNAAVAVGKRIGEASAVFNTLCDVWKHTNISRQRKIEIYVSCVISKLVFSLECEVLRQRDRERLNAFHCRCLRRILKIPPSWISRVPNNVVLTIASSEPLANKVMFQQLMLVGKIAKLHNDNFLRQLTFEPFSVNPSKCIYRRRGRPRLAWQSVLHGLAISSSPQGAEVIQGLLLGNAPINAWRQHLIEHF